MKVSRTTTEVSDIIAYIKNNVVHITVTIRVSYS